jgi:hypothetical protein
MSARRLGAVLALGVLLALLIDLALQFAMNAARIQAGTVNWEAAVASKAVWLVAVAIGAAIAPALLPLAKSRMERPDAYRAAAVILIAAPLVWTAATVLVFAVNIPWTQSSFYAQIITSIAPWMLAGILLRMVQRHID